MKITKGWLVCLAISLVSVAGADTLRTVTLSGTLAPGTSENFQYFFHAVINDVGQTAFFGHPFGRGGIWSERNGSLTLVAHSGEGAPGTSGDFYFLDYPSFNNSGQTAFLGGFADSVPFSDVNRGIWTEGNGSLALVALEGGEAPGTDRFFSALSLPILNDLGQTAFRGGLYTNDAVDGIWSEGNGSLALVAGKGGQAPGTNSTFFSFGYGSLGFNNAGQTVFQGNLSTSDGSGILGNGVWSEGSGSLDLVALRGDRAPGTNVIFSSFGHVSPVINDAGKVAFKAHLAGEGVSFGINDEGIWSERSGSLALVARAGSNAPDTNANFSSFSSPALNDAGQIAFQGRLVGDFSSNNGIWSEGNGTLSLVARAGSSAPGTDASFLNFDFFGILPILNAAGQTAFEGVLAGPDVDDSNDRGIWAQDLSGVLTLIVRKGDLLDANDGPETDYRTISDVFFVGGGPSAGVLSRGSGFNDRGQVAFYATFTDGTSGIFVSNLVAIPEPASAMLLFTALAMCGARRRRS